MSVKGPGLRHGSPDRYCLKDALHPGLACRRSLPNDSLWLVRGEHNIAAPIDERGAGQVVAGQEEGPIDVGEVDAVVARGLASTYGHSYGLYGLDVIPSGAGRQLYRGGGRDVALN